MDKKNPKDKKGQTNLNFFLFEETPPLGKHTLWAQMSE
jgi:hypothetical protein